MSVIRRNIIANVTGKAWTALVSLAAVPIYIHFLGIEAYGLIGVFLSLMAIFSLLDLGLGTTLNRQLAQYSAQSGKAQEMRDLVRTFEIIYWLIGIAIGITVAALAPLIAGYWIKSRQLSTHTVTQALVMMGIAFACQWPRALYAGGLMGMQRQVMLNVFSAVMVTVLGVGSVVMVWAISPTIQAFLAWHIGIGLTDTLLTGLLLWRCLPCTTMRSVFNARLLAAVWRFAAGMTGITVTSVFLTQFDKVILSKVLTLESFGYYSLAWRVAQGLYYLVTPITTAFFPRFSQLAALSDQLELPRLYHRACQLMSAVVLPVTVILALFPVEFLLLWTTNTVIADNSGTMLALLVIGTALNGLMSLPLALQLAHGRTRLVFFANTGAVVALAPLIYYMSLRYGGVGAAWVWVILNSGYVVFLSHLMHRQVLPGQLCEWYLVDVGVPLAAALATGGFWKLAIGLPGPYSWMLLNLAAVSALTALASVCAAPQTRELLLQKLFDRAPREARL